MAMGSLILVAGVTGMACVSDPSPIMSSLKGFMVRTSSMFFHSSPRSRSLAGRNSLKIGSVIVLEASPFAAGAAASDDEVCDDEPETDDVVDVTVLEMEVDVVDVTELDAPVMLELSETPELSDAAEYVSLAVVSTPEVVLVKLGFVLSSLAVVSTMSSVKGLAARWSPKVADDPVQGAPGVPRRWLGSGIASVLLVEGSVVDLSPSLDPSLVPVEASDVLVGC